MKKAIVFALIVTGCQTTTAKYTPEGCPIYYGELMREQTRACVAAYHAEKARHTGGIVTTCYETYGGKTCVTE